MMRIWYLFFLALTLGACSKTPQEKVKLASTICAEPTLYVEKSTFYGTVQAQQSSPLSVQTEGVIDWLTKPGDEVQKSETIAKINNPEIEKTYELATHAEAIAKQQYTRSSSLAKSNTNSQQQLQEREQAWIKTKLDLTKAEQDYKKLLFTAPFDGIVGPQLIHAGTHAKAGEIIGHFFNPKHIVVEVQIPVSFKSVLKKGQTAIIQGKEYSLPHVPKMLNPDTHMMVIHIPIQDSSLLIGEVIDVQIHLKEWPNAIVLPLGAIKFEDDKSSVLIWQKDGLKKCDVTIAKKDAKQAVILTGIKPGEIICLDPHHNNEGDKITPNCPQL